MVVDAVLLQIVAFGLSILFLAAGAQKLAHREQFAAAVAAYALAPAWTMPVLLVLIPVFELGIGAGLLFGAGSPVVVLAAATLLTAYALAMVINLRRGRHHIDCGCQLGSAPQQISYALVVRNLLLVVATGLLLFPADERALSWFDHGVTSFGVVMACLLYGIGSNLAATYAKQLAP